MQTSALIVGFAVLIVAALVVKAIRNTLTPSALLVGALATLTAFFSVAIYRHVGDVNLWRTYEICFVGVILLITVLELRMRGKEAKEILAELDELPEEMDRGERRQIIREKAAERRKQRQR